MSERAIDLSIEECALVSGGEGTGFMGGGTRQEDDGGGFHGGGTG